MLTFFVGVAVGLPIGGLLMWAFNSYLKADLQKIETKVEGFTSKGGKVSGK